MDKVRVDKWLWSVRLFKTRTSAGKACDRGHVRIGDDVAKPASKVAVGDEVRARIHQRTVVVRVERLIAKRVGASIAQDCYTDITPEELKRPAIRSAFVHPGQRERGAGRPTKKERREMDRWRSSDDPELD